MTPLGTIRKNRKELPSEFVNAKNREMLSTMFAFRDDATLVSYCAKKGKVVTLLSSLHCQAEVDNTHLGKKPQMILDYNATKGGVDRADQMLRAYTTKNDKALANDYLLQHDRHQCPQLLYHLDYTQP